MNNTQMIILAAILGIFILGVLLVALGHGIGGGSDHHAYRDPLNKKDRLR